MSLDLAARARAWTELEPDELRDRALDAANAGDPERLWALAEAHLATWGRAGARLSPSTLRNYRRGLAAAVLACPAGRLLEPPRDWGAAWLLDQAATGLGPSSLRVNLAAARALWAALRWARATIADPFADVRPPRDPTPPWEKRHPYPQAAVDRLLEHAGPRDAVLVLLGAHAALRISEACALEGHDVDLHAGTLRVRYGKGGKARTVSASRRLVDALRALNLRPDQVVLDLGPQGARQALRRLCARAGVAYQAAHSLRHTSGTRLYRETGDLEKVARHLGHASLETSRIYAKFANEALSAAVTDW